MTAAYTLTPAGEQDTDALHDLFCVPLVYRYLADGARPPRSITDDWVAKSAADFGNHGVGLWRLRAGERLAGCVRLEMRGETTEADLTYVLHPDYWGKGLATCMAWTVMAHAVTRGIDTIIAGADAPNTASLAVMKRLGMRFYRKAQYPAGEGIEYIFRKSDPPPASLPAVLPMSDP